MRIEPKLEKIKGKRQSLTQKQEELLNNYFDVDNNAKTLTSTIVIAKTSDILNTEFKVKSGILLNNNIWDKIQTLIDMAPRNYYLKVVFEIEDLEGYNPDDLMQALQSYINVKYYHSAMVLNRKKLSALLLAVVGVILLAVSVAIQVSQNISEVTQTIVYEVVDIMAWVFVWEAVTVYFLDSGEIRANMKTIRKRLLDITICGSNKENATSKSNENLFEDNNISTFNSLSGYEPIGKRIAEKVDQNRKESSADIDILTEDIEPKDIDQ